MVKYNKLLVKLLLLTTITGFSLLLPSTAIAKNTKPKPITTSQQKTIELPLDHPYKTFDSRAKLNHSINQITSKGLDCLGNKGLDNNIAGRVLKKSFEGYFGAYLPAYVTHETAHDGTDSNFSSNFDSRLLPKIKSKDLPIMSTEEKIAYYTRGLNQNTFNSNRIIKNSVINNEVMGLSLLSNGLALAFYSPNEEIRTDGNAANDLEEYSKALAEIGINLSKEKIKKHALIAKALTFQNWGMLYNNFRYLATGKKENTPRSFKGITPPNFSVYLGQTGLFYNATSFINTKSKTPFSLSIGLEDDVARIGGQIYNLKTPIKNLTASPFLYANIGSKDGHSVGTDLEYKVGKGFSITGTLEHNENDLMANIKETNGTNITAGIKFIF